MTRGRVLTLAWRAFAAVMLLGVGVGLYAVLHTLAVYAEQRAVDAAAIEALASGLDEANQRLEAEGAEPVPTPSVTAPAPGRVVEVITPGPSGKDGRDGQDGEDGRDGADAEPVPGPSGASGQDGAAGRDGTPGRPPTPDEVLAAVRVVCAEVPSPCASTVPGPQGEKGDKGDPGPPGQEGPPGPAAEACPVPYQQRALWVDGRDDPMLPTTQAWRDAVVCLRVPDAQG